MHASTISSLPGTVACRAAVSASNDSWVSGLFTLICQSTRAEGQEKDQPCDIPDSQNDLEPLGPSSRNDVLGRITLTGGVDADELADRLQSIKIGLIIRRLLARPIRLLATQRESQSAGSDYSRWP